MSWSVQAMGKGEAVGRALQKQFDAISQMAAPEQSIKDKVAEIVAAATAGAPESGFVVRANGHQYTTSPQPGAPSVMVQMSLKVEIDVVAFAE